MDEELYDSLQYGAYISLCSFLLACKDFEKTITATGFRYEINGVRHSYGEDDISYSYQYIKQVGRKVTRRDLQSPIEWNTLPFYQNAIPQLCPSLAVSGQVKLVVDSLTSVSDLSATSDPATIIVAGSASEGELNGLGAYFMTAYLAEKSIAATIHLYDPCENPVTIQHGTVTVHAHNSLIEDIPKCDVLVDDRWTTQLPLYEERIPSQARYYSVKRFTKNPQRQAYFGLKDGVRVSDNEVRDTNVTIPYAKTPYSCCFCFECQTLGGLMSKLKMSQSLQSLLYCVVVGLTKHNPSGLSNAVGFSQFMLYQKVRRRRLVTYDDARGMRSGLEAWNDFRLMIQYQSLPAHYPNIVYRNSRMEYLYKEVPNPKVRLIIPHLPRIQYPVVSFVADLDPMYFKRLIPYTPTRGSPYALIMDQASVPAVTALVATVGPPSQIIYIRLNQRNHSYPLILRQISARTLVYRYDVTIDQVACLSEFFEPSNVKVEPRPIFMEFLTTYRTLEELEDKMRPFVSSEELNGLIQSVRLQWTDDLKMKLM